MANLLAPLRGDETLPRRFPVQKKGDGIGDGIAGGNIDQKAVLSE